MKYTEVCYEDADDAARFDLEDREPMTPAEYEARLEIDEITDETESVVQELLQEY